MTNREDKKRGQLDADREKIKSAAERLEKQIAAIRCLFSEQTTERLMAKFGELFSGKGCPMCGHNIRGLGCLGNTPRLVMIPMTDAPEPEDPTRPFMGLSRAIADLVGPQPDQRAQYVNFAMICQRCGLTTLHNAAVLGLLDLSESAEAR